MREAVVDDFTDEVVDHSVESLAAVLTGCDQLEPAQECELMAERGHSQPEGPCQIPDAELTVRERVHDADADRIGECLEHLCGIAHHLLDGEAGSRRLDAPGPTEIDNPGTITGTYSVVGRKAALLFRA